MSNFKERKQKNMKKLIFDYLTPEENDPIPQKIFNYFYSSLIIINILSVILETESSIYLKYSSIFGLIEQISIIIFFIEYILRIYTADLIPAYQNIKKPYKRRIRYIFSFIALFDLLSFLPFYFIRTDFRFLKMFRLFRFLRIFKIERYSKSINLIGKIFKTRKHEFISAFIIVIFLIVFSSCLIYMVVSKILCF
jgi:voltage-gated potassium channel